MAKFKELEVGGDLKINELKNKKSKYELKEER